jgi:hypothetical protein
MKKMFCLLLLAIGFAFSVQAQKATIQPLIAGDTVVNTATVSKVISVSAGYVSVSFQPIVTKISGTVGGSAYILGSHDGVNYFAVSDTITLANATIATAGKSTWAFPPNWSYYKLNVTGTGTMSAQVRLWVGLKSYHTD